MGLTELISLDIFLPPIGSINDKSTYKNKMVLMINSSKSKSFNNYNNVNNCEIKKMKNLFCPKLIAIKKCEVVIVTDFCRG